MRNNNDDPSCSIELPGLPFLASRGLLSYLVAPNMYAITLAILQVQLEALERQDNPKILVNTFDALEPEALREIEKFNLI
jgi:hypothetical protein